MSISHLLVVNTSMQPIAATAYLTPGRLWSLAAALVGIIGVILGGLALARSTGRIRIGNRRRAAVVALVTGMTSMIIGGLVVGLAEGGPGTGYGIVGGFADLALGLGAMVLGWVTLARSRRGA